jgi:hypothetical protein
MVCMTFLACEKKGCTKVEAENFDPDAKVSDDKCVFPLDAFIGNYTAFDTVSVTDPFNGQIYNQYLQHRVYIVRQEDHKGVCRGLHIPDIDLTDTVPSSANILFKKGSDDVTVEAYQMTNARFRKASNRIYYTYTTQFSQEERVKGVLVRQ